MPQIADTALWIQHLPTPLISVVVLGYVSYVGYLLHIAIRNGHGVEFLPPRILPRANEPAAEKGPLSIVPAVPLDVLPFQSAMIESLRDIYLQRVRDINNLTYTESLNWENDFLQRVRALYNDAQSVYAVTLSSISDFWISEPDRQLILQYLQMQQDKQIHRLFVFRSPYELAKYYDVLKANYLAYGNSGGVYLASMRQYTTGMVPQFADSAKADAFLDRDFGVWEYEQRSLLATLQGTQLSFEEITNDFVKGINVSVFKRTFVQPAVIRWEPDMPIEQVASRLFDDDITYVGTVTHLVLLKSGDKSVLDEITSKIVRLDTIQRDAARRGVSISFSQEEPWWGRNQGDCAILGKLA